MPACVRALRPEETFAALQLLRRAPRLNLLLLDQVLELAEHAGVALRVVEGGAGEADAAHEVERDVAMSDAAREVERARMSPARAYEVARVPHVHDAARMYETALGGSEAGGASLVREAAPNWWRRLTRRAPEARPRPELLAYWRGAELCALAQVQQGFLLDAHADARALRAILAHAHFDVQGMAKGRAALMDALREELAAHGCPAAFSRVEYFYALEASRAARETLDAARALEGFTLRPAAPDDLDALVHCARGSLRAERRPDPGAHDPRAFRRWVRARLSRATVGVCAGEVVFVGYSDVTRACGWLLQGVFTAPAFRRRGFARAGVAHLCARAFDAGADHVQLSVVADNAEGVRLYERLGFTRFATGHALLLT